MIPRFAAGEEITPAKLNPIIDALNAAEAARSSLPIEQTSAGTRISVPRRPRSFYAIIKESTDRPRDLNGEVPDGEYEWVQVYLSPKEGFEEVEGRGLRSYWEVSTGFLYNPAYDLNDNRKVETGMIVRMRPVEPIGEPDVLALDDDGNPILDDDGNPVIEEKGRGFLRRYVFSPAAGAVMKMVEIQPNKGKRYGTVNHMGVFDAKTINLDPDQGGDLREADYSHEAQCWVLALRETCESMTQLTYTPPIVGAFIPGEQLEQENSGATGWLFEDDGTDLWIHTGHDSPDFTGNAADIVTGKSSGAEATPSDVHVPQSTLDEEKVNLLPSHTRFKGLLVGVLDFDGDERPLYVIDHDPGIRQFVLLEDWVQNADETWPLHVKATFADQPEEPGFELYRPSELDNDALSAYYLGVGRKGWEGHHGSVGFCRWSPATNRWEVIEGCFKIVALGVVTEAAPGIPRDWRGEVTIYWKSPVVPPAPPDPWTAAVSSTHKVEAFNFFFERMSNGTRVALAFDRQENLWMIVTCEWPVMVDGIAGAPDFEKEVGKLIFDDVVPALGASYFLVTAPNPGEVQIETRNVGDNFTHDPRTLTSITVVNGLVTAHAH